MYITHIWNTHTRRTGFLTSVYTSESGNRGSKLNLLKIEILSRFHVCISSQVQTNCTKRVEVCVLCGQTSKTAREKLLLSLRVSLSYPFAVFCLQALFRLNRDFVEISCPYLVTSPNKLYVASHSTRALRPDIENRVRKASITPLYPYFRFLQPERSRRSVSV